MMKKLKVTLAAGLAAAVVFTSIGVSEADARSRQHRNNAAAAGLMLGLIGTAAAFAAADNSRDRYYDNGYRYRGDRGYRRNGGYRGNRVYVAPPNRNPNHQGPSWVPQSLPPDHR